MNEPRAGRAAPPPETDKALLRASTGARLHRRRRNDDCLEHQVGDAGRHADSGRRAAPGAQGRGGQIIRVTQSGVEGPGSFRAAVETKGRRSSSKSPARAPPSAVADPRICRRIRVRPGSGGRPGLGRRAALPPLADLGTDGALSASGARRRPDCSAEWREALLRPSEQQRESSWSHRELSPTPWAVDTITAQHLTAPLPLTT